MSPIKPTSKAKAVDMDSMWIVYKELAEKYKACLLASGTPDVSVPNELKKFLEAAVNNPSSNWYTAARGSPNLLNAVLKYYAPVFNGNLQSTSQIQISIGAYQAIYYIFQSFVEKDDEVLCFEPFFDCYKMNALISHSKLMLIQLRVKENKWEFNKEDLCRAISPKTKMIVLNTPHNPTGKVFTREELELIAEISKEKNLLVLSDDVYEDYTYDSNEHYRIANFPGMWERTITVGSAGKKFGVTGWRLGWAIGPTELIRRLNHICICDNFSAPTPLQEAISGTLNRDISDSIISPYRTLYYNNYKVLTEAFTKKGFRVIQTQGSYFMVIDFVDLVPQFMKLRDEDEELKESKENLDVIVCKLLVKVFHIACLPLSLFYGDSSCYHGNNNPPPDIPKTLLRVTFSKAETTVNSALQLINDIKFM